MLKEKENLDERSLLYQIEKNEIFKDLSISKSEISGLDPKLLSIKKGESIFQLEDPSDYIYLILEGEIDVIKKQSFGKTQTCILENQFFGHTEFFLGTARNSIAIALKDSWLVELSKRDIDYLINRYPQLLTNVKNNLADLDTQTITVLDEKLKNLTDMSSSIETHNNQKSQIFEEKVHEISMNQVKINAGLYSTENRNEEQLKNQLFQYLNEYLSFIEKEKNQFRDSVINYKTILEKLENEISILKKRETDTNNIKNEKNEIVAAQTYKIVKLENELAKLKGNESDYKNQIEILIKEKENSRFRISELESKLVDSKTVIFELNESVSKLSKEIYDNRYILESQKTKLDKFDQELEVLTQESSRKDKKLEDLHSEIENKNEFISAQNENLDNFRAEIEQLRLKIEDSNMTATNLSEEINDYKELVEKQKSELNEFHQKIKILTQDSIEKDKNIIELQTGINNKTELISKQNDNLSKCKNDIERLELKLEDREATIRRLSKEIDVNKSVTNEQNVELNNINAKVQILTQASSEKDKKLNELLITTKEQAEMISEQKIKFDKLKADKEQLELKLSDRETTVTRLSEEMTELKMNINNLSSEAKKKDEYIFGQSSKLSENETELKEYKNQLNINNDKIELLQRRIENLSNENKQKEILLNQQSKSISELSEKASTGENDIKAEQLNLQIEENNEIRKKLNDLNDNLKQYEHLINARDSEIDELKTKLNDVQKLNEQLTEQKTKYSLIDRAYNELIIENEKLKEETKNSERKVEELLELNHELEELKISKEKYENTIIEKDNKIIELQKWYSELEAIAADNIKAFSDTKAGYEEDITNKNFTVNELKEKINETLLELEEKELIISQQTEMINSQSQKIAELELRKDKLNNISEETETREISRSENEIHIQNEEVPVNLSETSADIGILSKAELIASNYVDSGNKDESLEYYKYDEIHIVNVNISRATMDLVPSFNSTLQEIINDEQYKILVDLTNCEFIDSSIIGVLLNNIKKATKLGGDLRLIGLQPAVHSMMELTGLFRIFSSYKTLEEAVASFEE